MSTDKFIPFCDNPMCNQHGVRFSGDSDLNIMHDEQLVRIQRYEFRNTTHPDYTTRNFLCSICISAVNTVSNSNIPII